MPETFRSENRQRYVCACQNKEDKSLMKATPDLAWPGRPYENLLSFSSLAKLLRDFSLSSSDDNLSRTVSLRS